MKKLIIYITFFIVLFSCSNNENKLKFNNGEIYYTAQVQKADAEKLGNYLTKEGFFNEEEKTVQLGKDGNTWQFRVVVKKGVDVDDQFEYLFGLFGAQLSKSVFNNEPVDIHLCNEKLQTLRVIPFNISKKAN